MVVNYSTVGLLQSGDFCNEPLRTWINSTLNVSEARLWWFSLCPISVSLILSGLERVHDEDLMHFAAFTLLCLLNMLTVQPKPFAQAISALLKIQHA